MFHHDYCHKQLLPLAENSRSGYCSKCQGWLGITSEAEKCESESLSAYELEWQLWVAENVGNLIAAAPGLSSFPDQEIFKTVISAYAHQVTQGNLSAFARLLGKPSTTVYEWCSGKKIPKLSTILQICHFLGTSLLNLLTEEVLTLDDDWIVRQSQGKQLQKLKLCQRQSFDWEQFRQALLIALKEEPPPTLAEVIRRMGYIPTEIFYTHFPDLTRNLAARRIDYQKTEREKMQRALLSVLKGEEDPPPALLEVARRVGFNTSKLNRHFPDLCRMISARYLHYHQTHRLLTERIHQQVRQAALELHAKEMNPHGKSVGKLLSKPGIMLNKEAQAALREVRCELGYEKSGD